MRATLAADQSVDFIDDHGADGGQHAPAAVAGQQDVDRFRGGDQDVRRRLRHAGADVRGRVASADLSADGELHCAVLKQSGVNGFQRPIEVFLNVVAERLQRRDVKDAGFVR